MIEFILALAVAFASQTPKGTPLQDDGFGVCPAFSHYHDPGAIYIPIDPRAIPPGGMPMPLGSLVGDGKCHSDDDDSVVDAKTGKKLPKPQLPIDPAKLPPGWMAL